MIWLPLLGQEGNVFCYTKNPCNYQEILPKKNKKEAAKVLTKSRIRSKDGRLEAWRGGIDHIRHGLVQWTGQINDLRERQNGNSRNIDCYVKEGNIIATFASTILDKHLEDKTNSDSAIYDKKKELVIIRLFIIWKPKQGFQFSNVCSFLYTIVFRQLSQYKYKINDLICKLFFAYLQVLISRHAIYMLIIQSNKPSKYWLG